MSDSKAQELTLQLKQVIKNSDSDKLYNGGKAVINLLPGGSLVSYFLETYVKDPANQRLENFLLSIVECLVEIDDKVENFSIANSPSFETALILALGTAMRHHQEQELEALLGENRATQDLDLVIDLEAQTAPMLIDAMSGEFYISSSAVNKAIARSRRAPRESSFNVIYLPSMEKAEIFVMSADDPFSASVMSRRLLHPASNLQEEGIYIYSPEDIVLEKLSWYKLTRGGSQKQWRDVLGVLKVQFGRLDIAYMNQWAQSLELTDLLDEALLQSGY
ncbi:MAG: hypothetical protein ACRC62_38825 [Microcoleus sp.]